MRRPNGSVGWCTTLALLFVLVPGELGAEPATGGPKTDIVVRTRRVYNLEECIELAERNFPKVHQAIQRRRVFDAQLDEARSAPYSDFTLRGGFGVAPTVRGTSIYSPNTDVSLSSDLGLAWQVGIEGAIPLWTFGKISNLSTAARAQVEVGEHGIKKERNEVKLAVRKAYYGILLARDVLALLGEAEARIEKYETRLAERVEAGEGDEIELLKLRMHRAELDARHGEVLRQERIAVSGLKFLTGVRGALDVPDLPLRRAAHHLLPLANYLAAARLFRPEINMARAGVVARRAQVELERARYYPDLALGVSGTWMNAPEVTDQTNPFVQDPANRFAYGLALVFRWKLDFLPQAARLAQAEAVLEEMRATERFALGGVGVEVEAAFAEAVEAERRVEAYTRAARYARQWLIKVQQGIDVGTFDDEDIVDPAKEYALKKFSQMSAIYDYNVSLSKLAQATGWDAMLSEK